MTTKCKSCGADIMWCRTMGGKSMPVDTKPDADGSNVFVVDGLAKVLSSTQLEQARTMKGVTLFTSHFVTCPEAGKWRKG